MKRMETIIHYLQTMESIQNEFESKFQGLDELRTTMMINNDATRLDELVQVNIDSLF
jgi:hypothetical protein